MSCHIVSRNSADKKVNGFSFIFSLSNNNTHLVFPDQETLFQYGRPDIMRLHGNSRVIRDINHAPSEPRDVHTYKFGVARLCGVFATKGARPVVRRIHLPTDNHWITWVVYQRKVRPFYCFVGCVAVDAHDDVIKWKHFSALLPLCEGNPPVTGGFPSQRPVTRSFDVFFDLHLNKRLSKQ